MAAQWKADAADPAAIAANGFEPLNRWKAAVLAGDRATLAAMYALMQGAFTQTPQGRSTDPYEEPEYWTRLRANGLQALNPKILQASQPQPGVVVLALRIEITVQQRGKTIQGIISGSQVWIQQASGWYIYRTQRTDPSPLLRVLHESDGGQNSARHLGPADRVDEIEHRLEFLEKRDARAGRFVRRCPIDHLNSPQALQSHRINADMGGNYPVTFGHVRARFLPVVAAVPVFPFHYRRSQKRGIGGGVESASQEFANPAEVVNCGGTK